MSAGMQLVQSNAIVMLTMLQKFSNLECMPATAVPAHLSQLCHLELARFVLLAGDAPWQWCTASLWQGALPVHPQAAAS